MRQPDPRDHPAPAPDLRHAARPRGHPRAGPLARRRDGRHRRGGRRSSGSTRSSRCAPRRASWRGIIKASRRTDRHGAAGARSRRGVAEPAVEINRLENEADRVHQNAVRRLFEEERDPIAIMKWKEILDFLEEATDRCEDVANVARRRRREARLIAGWIRTCSRSSTLIARRAGLRLHQRLPRRGQLDRHRRLDPRADARQGGDLGRLLQFRRGVHLRHRGRARPSAAGLVDVSVVTFAVIFAGLLGRDRLGPDHLVLRAADELVARADRRLRRRGRRQGRLRRDHRVGLDQDADLHRAGAAHRA